jgi:hypothetical protein
MGTHLGTAPGGIAGVVAELRDHGDAIQADLLRAGWHVRDLTLAELVSWIRNPARDSAHARQLLAEGFEWTLETHLLAGIHDRLAEANWQRQGKGPRPTPLPRPGVKADDGKTRFGGSAGRSPTEMMAELARMAGRAPMSETPGLPAPGYEPGQDARAQAALDLERAVPAPE